MSEDNSPLWKYVTKLDKVAGGGNVSFKCNYCQNTFTGSYSRVKCHLLKVSGSGIRACIKVTSEHLTEMKIVVEEAEKRVKASMLKKVPLPTSGVEICSSSIPMGASQTKKRKGGESTIQKSLNLAARQQMTSLIARIFYSAGLPFYLARNPHYVDVSRNATADSRSLSGYIPPGYNQLRTTLLKKERANIERLLEPIKSTWKEKGVSIVSDGWSDTQRRPIINMMAVCEGGPMFLKGINCEGEFKDKFCIANLLKETINAVGPNNVVQVVTDNAPVCRGAGLLIEAQFPHIFWTPCVVHTLNLALKNICAAKDTIANAETYDECKWIKEIITDVVFIENFIMNHSMRFSMFNEHVKLKLLSVAETRFASSIVMLRRFKEIKQGLESMVISSRWSTYQEDDVGKAEFVREHILKKLWWDKINYILDFTDPIYEMLRLADTDMPCLHLIYSTWDSMINKVKKVIYLREAKEESEFSAFYLVVHRILASRWDKSSTPLHCLAHSLNPRHYSSEWINESSTCLPPHRDEDVSRQRLKCFERYFEGDELRGINTEYAKFSAGIREFGNVNCLNDRFSMEPIFWWITYGTSTPLLQTLALKLLGQPCSSSCCERNWSTYSFINSFRRNKITPKRGEDLVFVHSNLRLLSRRDPRYKQEETRMWDIGGDQFDTLEGAGILEVAHLSLDEPELESVLFGDSQASVDADVDVNEG